MSTARIAVVLVVYLLANDAGAPGACCLSNGECFILDGNICDTVTGSYWAGDGTDCFDRDGGGSPDACFPARQKMFWIGGEGVFRSDHDGTNVQRVLIFGATDLVVDADRGKLYWYDTQGIGQIMRSDFVGTNTVAYVTGILGFFHTMSIDLAQRNLYFGASDGSYLFPLDLPEDDLPVPLASGRRFFIGGLDGGWGGVHDWTITRPVACDNMKMDANGDGRIDLRDYAAFQRCLSNAVDDEQACGKAEVR